MHRIPGIEDAKLLRAGGVAGLLSAVVAVVFNAVHPRASSRSLNDTGELLRIVAASRSWRLVHLASVAATLVGVGAIVAVLWAALLTRPSRWPVVAFVSLTVTTPILLLSVTLDGFAIKSVADRWAATGAADRDVLMAAATALRSTDVAVLNLVMVGHFGVTAALLGVACWTSARYGRAIGAVAIVAGVLGIVCGAVQALSGRLTAFSYLVLLTASLALFTLWLVLASLTLLRSQGVARP